MRKVLGTTLVHKFHIFSSHTEWSLLFHSPFVLSLITLNTFIIIWCSIFLYNFCDVFLLSWHLCYSSSVSFICIMCFLAVFVVCSSVLCFSCGGGAVSSAVLCCVSVVMVVLCRLQYCVVFQLWWWCCVACSIVRAWTCSPPSYDTSAPNIPWLVHYRFANNYGSAVGSVYLEGLLKRM